MPPNCDRGRAFQRIQPCQSGLPIHTRWASKTAGCSACWGARFDSPEALARAWFSLSGGDVRRRVQICVSFVPARRTHEVVAVAVAVFTTPRTILARVRGVHAFDADAFTFGLVGDEPAKLVEIPRVDARPSSTVADAFEVFEANQRIVELYGELHESFREGVIQVTDAAVFFVTHAVASTKCSRFRKRIA